MRTYTFRLGPDKPVTFTVDAANANDAFAAANAHYGYIKGFYAWFGGPDELAGPNFTAGYGVWD